MALTESFMAPLKSPLPSFTVPDVVAGQSWSSNQHVMRQGLVVMFWCNHCPFVQHIQSGVLSLARAYLPQGMDFIAISANDAIAYPDDAPDKMRQMALEQDFPFPYLYDESQAVAKAFQAVCTPDFFVYDDQSTLVYRGQFDDSRPGNHIPVDGASLKAVLNDLKHQSPVTLDQKPSIGCSIKWKE